MTLTLIKKVHAREIIDCRGLPTLEVDIDLEGGAHGRAGVPAGLSTSSHEAHELRDGEKRYRGLGVRKAIQNVNEIIQPALVGKNALHQRELDTLLIEYFVKGGKILERGRSPLSSFTPLPL